MPSLGGKVILVNKIDPDVKIKANGTLYHGLLKILLEMVLIQ